ncbi:segregation/condensation protein A [Rhodospirillum rubrum]|uniref:segregation and condensation protein A n=1 Tax=Rhodospirillum rubrum TaxID=1085 RepID=UPI001EBF6131|nr:ScpA family protein [Rhodospirillum rubrum]MBK1663575.1 segregation/condensation protein A [Rhodospirillum rubrum]MBK1675624.1 segregation/condensation protein A [Rhodospirillum rubrum]
MAGDDFMEDPGRRAAGRGSDDLVLDLDGFEGPIDVLLTLARSQKVDLTKLSILRLAEQYLAFVARARQIHLELAGDYLVMAAWLAYLKSRLLIPAPKSEEEPSGEDMAAALQFHLRRLEAMQQAGTALMARPRLGRDVFARGAPEGVAMVTRTAYQAGLYDLLRAYGKVRRSLEPPPVLAIEAFTLYSVEDAIRRIGALLGGLADWTPIRNFLPPGLEDPLVRRSAVAATFVATLELAKQGVLDLRQDGGVYAPITVRPVVAGDRIGAAP